MSKGPSVLVVDDGELENVRDALDELDVDYAHLRGSAVPGRLDPPMLLFVTTPRHAALVERWPGRAEGGPAKIAVAAEDSNALRDALRGQRFDFLVRMPVHREALRLLLLRAVYTGEERRRERRFAIGCEVQCRTGLRRRSATLIELSSGGARLLASQPLPVGSRLSLELPASLAGRGAWVRARVVRVRESARARSEVAIALAFEPLRAAQERALRTAIARCAEGALEHSPAEAASASPGATVAASETRPAERAREVAPEAPLPLTRFRGRQAERSAARVARGGVLPAAGAGAPSERRKSRRAAFAREVQARTDEARLVWMGRDISAGGMRIEPNPDLVPGQSFELAIYGEAGEPPIAARAEVVRNDGPDGVALRFERLSPAARRRLEALVAHLPSVEPLQGGESHALGSVVTRVLAAHEDERGER